MSQHLHCYTKYLLSSLILVALFFFVGYNSPIAAETGLNSSLDSTILAIDVAGNNDVSTETILKAVTNVRLGETWNAEKINKDIQAIQRLGYFLNVEAKGEPFLGGLKLVFHVTENPLFKGFEFRGLTVVDPKYLSSLFTQKQGETINLAKIQKDLSDIIPRCQEEKGYMLVFRDIHLGSDGKVTLTLAEVKLRKITITGLFRTKEIVVRRELTIKEGEVLNVNNIRDDYQKIARLGLFQGINPMIQPTEIPDWVDLVLEFTETEKVGQLNFGLGYSPSSGDITGNAKIAHPNLWGMARAASINFEFGEEIQNFYLEYYDPWFFPNQISLRSRIYYDSRQNREYFSDSGDIGENLVDTFDQTKTGFDITLGKPIAKNLVLNTSLNIQRVKSRNWSDLDMDKSGDGNQEYWNNSIGLSLVNDNRLFDKNTMVVTGGNRNYINASLYGLFDSAYDYTTYTAETAHYYTPWDKGPTFAIRAKGGMMDGEVPRIEGYELGGPTTLRGYKDSFIKDDKLLLINAEARYYLPKQDNIELVVFYDYGSVDWKNYFSSYGVGFRYNIPMLGQIRIDYGWNGEGDSPEFHFFIGEMF